MSDPGCNGDVQVGDRARRRASRIDDDDLLLGPILLADAQPVERDRMGLGQVGADDQARRSAWSMSS